MGWRDGDGSSSVSTHHYIHTFLSARARLTNIPVEGLITLFIAIVFTLFVPPSAGDGRPLIAFGRWHIIRNRVLLDDPRKAKGHIQISGSDIWQTVKQPRILQHVFVTLVSMTGFTGLTQYTPSMIKGLGFGAVKANALASVPVYCGMVWLIVLSYAA